MSLQIFALLLMVVSFTILGVWVYHPAQKTRWDNLAHIPLDDSLDASIDDVLDDSEQTNTQQSGESV